jgi:hypothetical protein
MSRATPEMREFAERLIACETTGNRSLKTSTRAPLLVHERLRPHLAALMGTVGFRALLSRALALAHVEIPWLRGVHVKADGSLEGLSELEARVSREEFRAGCIVLLARFLGLLVTFIGEDLARRLMRELWPKLPLNDFDPGKGDKQ